MTETLWLRAQAQMAAHHCKVSALQGSLAPSTDTQLSNSYDHLSEHFIMFSTLIQMISPQFKSV